jgi:hypothetical protein
MKKHLYFYWDTELAAKKCFQNSTRLEKGAVFSAIAGSPDNNIGRPSNYLPPDIKLSLYSEFIFRKQLLAERP